MEAMEEYRDRILAQFDTESPFLPRSRLQRTPVITSTPVGREDSPEGLNLGGAVSPVRETGTATTE